MVSSSDHLEDYFLSDHKRATVVTHTFLVIDLPTFAFLGPSWRSAQSQREIRAPVGKCAGQEKALTHIQMHP